MRQRADPRKIKALTIYYLKIREAFRNGTLKGKIGLLLKDKAMRLGIGLRTFQRHRKCLDE